jgi:hypothetical protein
MLGQDRKRWFDFPAWRQRRGHRAVFLGGSNCAGSKAATALVCRAGGLAQVRRVRLGNSVPADSFIFSYSDHRNFEPVGDDSSFEMCVGVAIDTGFQFFVGPALANWSKADGKYTGSRVQVIDLKYPQPPANATIEQLIAHSEKPRYVEALNRTFTSSTTCGMTISHGQVTFWIDKEEQIATFSISDKFIYEPPLLPSQFSTPALFLEPLIAPKSNYRLLPAKPYIFPSDPKMVLEMDERVLGTVWLYYGVKDYAVVPGRYNFEGVLTCGLAGLREKILAPPP